MSGPGQDWRPRVLIIEPEPEERRIRIHYAQTCGFRAIGVASGSDALRCLSRRAPDVIISALALPDMSGMRILECASRYWPPLRVVLTARWRTLALLRSVSRARASDLIRHPVRKREILAALARAWMERIEDGEPAP